MRGFIAYYRVSTVRGRPASGSMRKGLPSPGAAAPASWSLSSRKSRAKRNDRPQLAAALALCRRQRAMLVIAKLDRLARNVAFIANLMESGVEFTAVDMPSANKLTLHILSAVAEHKREMISARAKAALAAGARRDVGPTRPGNPAHARGPIGQPRRLARCRTQPGNRFGPWTEAAYGTRCSSVPLVRFPRPCRRTPVGQGQGYGTNPRPAS